MLMHYSFALAGINFVVVYSSLQSQAYCGNMLMPPDMIKSDLVCEFKELIMTRNSSSVGLDGICTMTIKRNLPILLMLLLHTVNLSITTATYPDLIKTSIAVIPVFKAEDSKITNNYEPISLQNST